MGRLRTRTERLERLLPDPTDAADGLVVTTSGGLYDLEPSSAPDLSPYMQKANDLSDVADAGTSRTNLGLGTAATHNVPASGDAASGEVVLGNDSRLGGASSIAAIRRIAALRAY